MSGTSKIEYLLQSILDEVQAIRRVQSELASGGEIIRHGEPVIQSAPEKKVASRFNGYKVKVLDSGEEIKFVFAVDFLDGLVFVDSERNNLQAHGATKEGFPFTCIRFKSMIVATEAEGRIIRVSGRDDSFDGFEAARRCIV